MDTWKVYAAMAVGILWGAFKSWLNSKARQHYLNDIGSEDG